MSLYGACEEALNIIRGEFLESEAWYPSDQLSRIFSAMYELAEYMVRESSPNASPREIGKMVDHLVVAETLDEAREQEDEEICSVLASIAIVNEKLSASIDAMIEDLSSPDRLFDVLKDNSLFNDLKSIKEGIELRRNI